MELIRSGTKFDFLGKRYIFIAISLALVGLALQQWFSLGDSKYGVDYRGGAEIVVKIREQKSSEPVRAAINKAGLSEAIVQSFEPGSDEYSIRLGEPERAKELVMGALKADFGDKVELLRTDIVGPTIGKELRTKALWAVSFGLLCILAYVSFRFEFAFALGAVVAVLHDVIVATGLYLLCGGQVNAAILAGALTIVGYSVNDTIVIFDRVREEIFKSKELDLVAIFNHSLNVTLSRTIITSLLTLFSASALLIFGGGAIRDLSLYLVFGLIAGSYSTIFIASPVVLAWDAFRAKKGGVRGAVASSAN